MRREVVSSDEVDAVSAELGVSFVVESLDGRLLGSVAPAFYPALRPRMLGLGQPMTDGVAATRDIEGKSQKQCVARDALLASPPDNAPKPGIAHDALAKEKYGVHFSFRCGLFSLTSIRPS